MQLQTPREWSNVPIAAQCGLNIPERTHVSFEWEKIDARPGLAQILRCSRQARWMTDLSAIVAQSQYDLKTEFGTLAAQWRRETRHTSSIHERSMNRAYQKIIRLGTDVVPLILRDLERTRDHWLWALDIIENDNPAEHAQTSDEAIDAWLQWGRHRGHLK